MNPIDYLRGFLEIIKSPETSGKLTGTALQGVQRILEHNLLAINHNEDDISRAVQNIAEAVTQCKFESKSAGFDECILTLASFVINRGEAAFNMVTGVKSAIGNLAGNIFNQIGHSA